MEEILSSIKRIIAEDSEAEERPRSPRRARAAARPAIDEDVADDGILELTDPVESSAEAPPDTPPHRPESPSGRAAERQEPACPRPDASPMLSAESEVAARAALSSLSSLIVKSQGEDQTLEGLVRTMLRPMLKEWLDANLPAIVQDMVAKEIARISGQNG